MREGNVYTCECLSFVWRAGGTLARSQSQMGEGYPPFPTGGTPSFLGGVTLELDGGTPCKDWMGLAPHGDWMGVASPRNGWQLDRLCHGRYASCGFPQEGLLVNLIYLRIHTLSDAHKRLFPWDRCCHILTDSPE